MSEFRRRCRSKGLARKSCGGSGGSPRGVGRPAQHVQSISPRVRLTTDRTDIFLAGLLSGNNNNRHALTNPKLVVLCRSFGAQASPLRHSSPIFGTLRASLV